MKTQHNHQTSTLHFHAATAPILAGAGMTTLGPACLPQQKSEEQNTQMKSMRTAEAPRTDAEKAGFNAQRSAPPLRATNLKPDPAQNLATEIALLQRVAQGDRESFEALYDRFSGVLFSTAYRVLNNQHAAEDTLQEVFIQIWEKASFYDPALGKPMTWAVTLTRHKAIDRLRSTQRRSRLQDEAQRESETAARRSEFHRCGRLRGEERSGPCSDSEPVQRTARSYRTGVLLLADAKRNRRSPQGADRDNQSPNPARNDQAAERAQPRIRPSQHRTPSRELSVHLPVIDLQNFPERITRTSDSKAIMP